MHHAPETRTAPEIEKYAADLDSLKYQYRRDRASGREGIRSVKADDLMAWDPFAELLFMEALLSGGACERLDHRGLTRHGARH